MAVCVRTAVPVTTNELLLIFTPPYLLTNSVVPELTSSFSNRFSLIFKL